MHQIIGSFVLAMCLALPAAAQVRVANIYSSAPNNWVKTIHSIANQGPSSQRLLAEMPSLKLNIDFLKQYGGLAPLVRQLQAKNLTEQNVTAENILAAIEPAKAEVASAATSLIEQVNAKTLDQKALPDAAAKLFMMQGTLSYYLPAELLKTVQPAYAAARLSLDKTQQKNLDRFMTDIALNFHDKTPWEIFVEQSSSKKAANPVTLKKGSYLKQVANAIKIPKATVDDYSKLQRNAKWPSIGEWEAFFQYMQFERDHPQIQLRLSRFGRLAHRLWESFYPTKQPENTNKTPTQPTGNPIISVYDNHREYGLPIERYFFILDNMVGGPAVFPLRKDINNMFMEHHGKQVLIEGTKVTSFYQDDGKITPMAPVDVPGTVADKLGDRLKMDSIFDKTTQLELPKDLLITFATPLPEQRGPNQAILVYYRNNDGKRERIFFIEKNDWELSLYQSEVVRQMKIDKPIYIDSHDHHTGLHTGLHFYPNSNAKTTNWGMKAYTSGRNDASPQPDGTIKYRFEARIAMPTRISEKFAEKTTP